VTDSRPGERLWPGWLGRLVSAVRRAGPYGVAVPLSAASAAVGLVREGLVLWKLGLTHQNDQLQFYLSVIYTVSLFGDAARLGTMNLLQEFSLPRVAFLVTALGGGLGLVTTTWYWLGTKGMLWSLTAVAGVGGVLNLLAVTLVVERQREGRFLMAHMATVSPNFLICAGALVAFPLSSGAFIKVIVLLFLSAPVLQIGILLAAGARFLAPSERRERSWIGPGSRQLGLHALQAVGMQWGQVLIRTGLSAASPGSLALFSIIARSVDAVRAVFVDSYIGSRVSSWAARREGVPTLLDPQRYTPVTLIAICALTAALTLVMSPGTVGMGSAAWYSAILILGAYLQFAGRVGYFFVNSYSSPSALILRSSGLNIALAGLMASLQAVWVGAILWLIWIFYVARAAIQLWLVRGYTLVSSAQ